MSEIPSLEGALKLDTLERTVRDVYAEAAREPDPTLCSIDGGAWSMPGLHVPPIMREMNYGCGSTVDPSDLAGDRPVVYIGVGGGLEALQLAYFRRRPGGVIAVDPVPEMRAVAARNLVAAARMNPWFEPEFVRILDGTATELPLEDGAADLVAQNCLFNVFRDRDLDRALGEAHRALAPGGRLSISDPIATRPIPEALRRNETLRARCCSGCRTYAEYVAFLHAAGFGRIVLRAKRPYRMLLPSEFPEVDEPLLLESIDLVALRVAAATGEVFSGRTAIYLGRGSFAFGSASLRAGMPVPVSDAVAQELALRPDFHVTPATYHASAGCC